MQTMTMAVIMKSAIFVIVFTFQIYEQPLIKVKRGGAHVYAYRISANNFRGNYSFLNLALCTVTFDYST